MIRIVSLCLLLSATVLAQITVQESDFQSLFNPGGTFQIYFADTATALNVGHTGGPSVYDFTGISFPFQGTTNIFLVSQNAQVAARYPGSAITFGQSPTFIENNPIIFFATDTLKDFGQVYFSADSQKYRHNTPPQPSGIFPAMYGMSWTSTGTAVETTYIGGVPVRVDTGYNAGGTTTIDGWGTLKLPGYNLQCLRMTFVETFPYTAKEFSYLTREGAYLSVKTDRNQPDTGMVPIDESIYLIGGSLLNVAESPRLPARTEIGQNYPNPFNPTTEFELRIAEFGPVNLTVYNVLGQEVATIVDKEMGPGTYEITWDARNMSSGVYYYRLQTGSAIATRKMVLLK